MFISAALVKWPLDNIHERNLHASAHLQRTQNQDVVRALEERSSGSGEPDENRVNVTKSNSASDADFAQYKEINIGADEKKHLKNFLAFANGLKGDPGENIKKHIGDTLTLDRLGIRKFGELRRNVTDDNELRRNVTDDNGLLSQALNNDTHHSKRKKKGDNATYLDENFISDLRRQRKGKIRLKELTGNLSKADKEWLQSFFGEEIHSLHSSSSHKNVTKNVINATVTNKNSYKIDTLHKDISSKNSDLIIAKAKTLEFNNSIEEDRSGSGELLQFMKDQRSHHVINQNRIEPLKTHKAYLKHSSNTEASSGDTSGDRERSSNTGSGSEEQLIVRHRNASSLSIKSHLIHRSEIVNDPKLLSELSKYFETNNTSMTLSQQEMNATYSDSEHLTNTSSNNSPGNSLTIPNKIRRSNPQQFVNVDEYSAEGLKSDEAGNQSGSTNDNGEEEAYEMSLGGNYFEDTSSLIKSHSSHRQRKADVILDDNDDISHVNVDDTSKQDHPSHRLRKRVSFRLDDIDTSKSNIEDTKSIKYSRSSHRQRKHAILEEIQPGQNIFDNSFKRRINPLFSKTSKESQTLHFTEPKEVAYGEDNSGEEFTAVEKTDGEELIHLNEDNSEQKPENDKFFLKKLMGELKGMSDDGAERSSSSRSGEEPSQSGSGSDSKPYSGAEESNLTLETESGSGFSGGDPRSLKSKDSHTNSDTPDHRKGSVQMEAKHPTGELSRTSGGQHKHEDKSKIGMVPVWNTKDRSWAALPYKNNTDESLLDLKRSHKLENVKTNKVKTSKHPKAQGHLKFPGKHFTNGSMVSHLGKIGKAKSRRKRIKLVMERKRKFAADSTNDKSNEKEIEPNLSMQHSIEQDSDKGFPIDSNDENAVQSEVSHIAKNSVNPYDSNRKTPVETGQKRTHLNLHPKGVYPKQMVLDSVRPVRHKGRREISKELGNTTDADFRLIQQEMRSVDESSGATASGHTDESPTQIAKLLAITNVAPPVSDGLQNSYYDQEEVPSDTLLKNENDEIISGNGITNSSFEAINRPTSKGRRETPRSDDASLIQPVLDFIENKMSGDDESGDGDFSSGGEDEQETKAQETAKILAISTVGPSKDKDDGAVIDNLKHSTDDIGDALYENPAENIESEITSLGNRITKVNNASSETMDFSQRKDQVNQKSAVENEFETALFEDQPMPSSDTHLNYENTGHHLNENSAKKATMEGASPSFGNLFSSGKPINSKPNLEQTPTKKSPLNSDIHRVDSTTGTHNSISNSKGVTYGNASSQELYRSDKKSKTSADEPEILSKKALSGRKAVAEDNASKEKIDPDIKKSNAKAPTKWGDYNLVSNEEQEKNINHVDGTLPNMKPSDDSESENLSQQMHGAYDNESDNDNESDQDFRSAEKNSETEETANDEHTVNVGDLLHKLLPKTRHRKGTTPKMTSVETFRRPTEKEVSTKEFEKSTKRQCNPMYEVDCIGPDSVSINIPPNGDWSGWSVQIPGNTAGMPSLNEIAGMIFITFISFNFSTHSICIILV